jgi:hypothetical protein
MPTCSTCNIALNESNAYRKGKRLQSYCKDCFNHLCTERWKRLKVQAIESLGGKCLDCQGTFHYSVYDFHHLDETTKEFDWSKVRLLSADRRQAELSKCILLCSNCHRIRHYS